MNALERRVSLLEATAQQHQARPALFVLHPDSRDHDGPLLVQVNDQSHTVARESSEPWPSFTARLHDKFAEGLLTFFYISPCNSEPAIAPEPL